MGNVLIIKNSDFSRNSVEKIDIGNTIPSTNSLFGVFYIDYQNVSNIRQGNTTNAGAWALITNTKLYVYIVEHLIGKTLSITSANYVISGANYDCFASDLGTLEFWDIATLGPVSQEGGAQVSIPINMIESFNVTTTTTGEKTTIQKVVPTGAKYLVITARFDEELLPEDVNVEVVEE